MAQNAIWGWYPEENKWVKLRVDEDGSVHFVGYVDKLEDIGDVLLTAIANNNILYWHAGDKKWKNIAHLGVADAHHTEDHKNRHDPIDGADKLDSAAPVKVGEANAIGSSHSISRADHVHEKHHAKYLDASAVSAVEAAGLALASGKNIKVISTLTADHTWSGLTAVMTAGIALTRGQAVYVGDNSKMALADKDLAATMPAVALCTPETLAQDAESEFLMQGFFRDDTWGWTPKGILYIGDDGALTQDVSGYTTGDQVQVVGIAWSATIIYFNPSFELVEIS